MKKFIKIINILYFSLFIVLEILAYQLECFKSLNIFLIIFFWFNWLYKFYGLTRIENIYRTRNPINFSFSLTYIAKLIIRSIKIKIFVLNCLVNEVRVEKLLITKVLNILVILALTLILVRYLRSVLILEIIQKLNLEAYIANILTLLSLIIVEIFITFLQLMGLNFSNPEYLYLLSLELAKDKKPDRVKENKIINWMMKKANDVANKLSSRLPPKKYLIPKSLTPEIQSQFKGLPEKK